MARKIKLAINWAAACGGCDVSILDLEQAILPVAELVEFVYWPVAMDFKREDLRALEPGSVDIGLFNGAVRTSEQEEDALLMRERCKVLVAYGSCACFGGIPGLANISDKQGIFQTVYHQTSSTDNPEGIEPQAQHQSGAFELELPEFFDAVKALHQVTEVDLFAPGCPPPEQQIQKLVEIIAAAATEKPLPAKGAFLASDKGLCDECPRQATRGSHKPDRFSRPHQIVPNPEECLLNQGILCNGIATRGGCGALCIAANMPCRGCFGPAPFQLDPGAELVSALAVLPGPRGEWDMPVHKVVSPATAIEDPLGTFYRFSYPVSLGRSTVRDKGRGE